MWDRAAKGMLSLSRCPLCRARASQVWGCCKQCHQKLALEPHRNAKDVMVLGSYAGMLKQAIRAFKYRNVTALQQLLGYAVAEAIRDEAVRFEIPLPQAVCAVPLHWRRWLERSYNQSRLVAQVAAKGLECEYLPLLTRTRYTQQQARLSDVARQKNVACAFALRQQASKPHIHYVLLVDDVVTTGATLYACAQVLREAGLQVIMAALAEA